jgi:hypothetical protein
MDTVFPSVSAIYVRKGLVFFSIIQQLTGDNMTILSE